MEQKTLFDTSNFEQQLGNTKATSPELVGNGQRGNKQRYVPTGKLLKSSNRTGQAPVVSTLQTEEETPSCGNSLDAISTIYTELWYKGIRGEMLIDAAGIILIVHLFREEPPDRTQTNSFDIRDCYSRFYHKVNFWTKLCPDRCAQWENAPRCRNPEAGCEFGRSCSLPFRDGSELGGSSHLCPLTNGSDETELGGGSHLCPLTDKPKKGWIEIKTIKGTRQQYHCWRVNGQKKSKWIQSLGPVTPD
ncbi:MAG: hypothetical protein F6K31_15045 [Symploca sp. SIO2G7]|nr:hypothetical protein [Symploca sp. SIO2G7]